MIAAALAGEFGTLYRVADEARFVIRRMALPGAEAMYLPPETVPIVALLPTLTSERRELYLAIAIGHHMLRHRSRRIYAYNEAGALYDAPREEAEAALFAREFLARARPVTNVVPMRARMPG